MKTIIKYGGGKSKELQYFLDYIPKFNTYYEPFFGGGATYFYLEPQKAVISDVNNKLIDFYKEISDENKFYKIKKELLSLQNKYEENNKLFLSLKTIDNNIKNENENLYYKIRDMFNNKIPSKYERATLYFFINKTSYSGMIRYNSKGHFNVPFGRYKNFNTTLLTENHHKLLKSTKIYNNSYEKLFSMSKEDDFIFLDPPYDTVFNDYGNEEFGEKEQRKLANNFKNLSTPALMIINETPLTVELYKDYIKDRYFKKYSVNIKNRFKSQTNHLIITNYKK